MTDYADFYKREEPVARKIHTCCECRGEILPKEKYFRDFVIYDDAARTYKTCVECQELYTEVTILITSVEDLPSYGELYDHIFESYDRDLIRKFMGIRAARNAPESPRGWMEKRLTELQETDA